ncbi:acetyltransferase (GNAT) family domain protein, partial [Bacteroides fragilis str. 3998 T(B) 4]
MVFKKIREHKEYIQDAASWFQAKWDIPQEEYLKSMNESLLKETSIPQWYIMLENDNS